MNTFDDNEVYKIESLCMSCEKKGTTTIFTTMIPFYKEVIISSFSCPHCNSSNSEIIQAKEIQTKGVRYTLVLKPEDYDRMVVKTDYAYINFPEIQFEIPPSNQKAEITTIEGILRKAYDGLDQDYGEKNKVSINEMPKDKSENEEISEETLKIRDFIATLKKVLETKRALTFILDDPTGNSFVQNPNAPSDDPNLKVTKYERTDEQNKLLGFAEVVEDEISEQKDVLEFSDKEFETMEGVKSEVMQFPSACSSCGHNTITNMKLITIPHFKELIIMASNCDRCGCKTNEVKPGGGIQAKGCKIDLHVLSMDDLSRDVVKSDNCVISIPELSLELSPTTLGARYSTVEGLLVNIKDQLSETNPFLLGDSSAQEMPEKFKAFAQKLDDYITGKTLGFHFILDDPTGNSFLTGVEDGKSTAYNIQYTSYERNWEQNEELGLNDMRV